MLRKLPVLIFVLHTCLLAGQPAMMYIDSSRIGKPFSKDPCVEEFKGSYFMYYSIPPSSSGDKGWGIGIARSSNLLSWTRVGELNPVQAAEEKGICAPCAVVYKGQLHLFYQTYGTFGREAICHAISDDGISFKRDMQNPVFRPSGSWNCGRAIDAEVVRWKDSWLMFFATRDTAKKIQMIGVASAPYKAGLTGGIWKQLAGYPVLKPELKWEQICIEAPSVIIKNEKMFMVYAGAYNNSPQQIGIAESNDGIRWTRLDTTPFLRNGKPGSWNSSESGHPDIFRNKKGKIFLFYQGNNDKGKTWYISNIEIRWTEGKPEPVK
jgi:beta-1,2-mannobiose phosphorylase / 1,2-beta-oligomannan phosphorylase